jgi:hypothetical protein
MSNIEDDVHRRQTIAYKLLKHLKSTGRGRAQMNATNEAQWIQH